MLKNDSLSLSISLSHAYQKFEDLSFSLCWSSSLLDKDKVKGAKFRCSTIVGFGFGLKSTWVWFLKTGGLLCC